MANSPNGTVFVFSPGVYEGVSVEPRAGQTFLGESGAVLDGNGKKFAFRSENPNVTIDGFEITDYRPSPKEGVIQGTRGWVVSNNEVHHNGEVGIKGTHSWRVVGNNVHHNGRYGLTMSGNSILIDGNEISHNSTDYGATGASGGTKFVHTEGLVLHNNNVHDNFGNGLWVDIDNVGYLIDGNRVVGNLKSGILIEISCGGVIRNNHVEGNGNGDTTSNWINGAGITVAVSPDVEVSGNTVVNNPGGGIGAIHWPHPNVGAVDRCRPQLKNPEVHDNVITQSSGAATGIDASIDEDKVWSSWSNRFRNNTYNVGSGDHFRWEGDWHTLSEWKAAGNS